MTTRHQISLPGGRTLVARSRPGEGVPVVLLHGLFGSADSWAEVCSALDRPCIAFDLPGFGESDVPTQPLVTAYAEDVAAALASLGVGRFELVGHSFGGAVAAAVADLVPERVASLLLLAPAGFGRNALAALGRRFCRGPERLATAALCSFPAPLGAFRGPVTALWGSRDRAVSPSHGRHVAAVFPQADVVVLDGADHHLVSGSREAVVDLIRSGRTPRRARRRPRLPRLALRFA